MTSDIASAAIREKLLADRRTLLDLGTRNRLINLPLRATGVRTVEIADGRAAEAYRLLTEGRAFIFRPGRALTAAEREAAGVEDPDSAVPPEPAAEPEAGAATEERDAPRRRPETQLQTRLTPEGLQRRLFDIWYDARTLEEEQGVNILFLALGLLRWYEADSAETPRHAPLMLLPVRLDRTSAADRFTLRWRAEPASANLSLQAKMNAEFGLKIVDLDDEDEIDLPGYMAEIAETVAAKPRWTVLPDAMVLGFFSFAKFLMYRDLDPENWPASRALDRHAVLAGLLRDGFPGIEPIVPEGAKIDPAIPPLAMNHVVDADSSQSIVVAEAARGNHLVVKGPPGTGKSQTITNIIAAAAVEGRKVLFVAEKMAALEVVQRRLRAAGLEALALELHSNKVSKRLVLEELKRTKELAPRPAAAQAAGDVSVIDRLTQARDALNRHAEALHRPDEPSGLTPYRLLGQLVRTADGPGLPGFALDRPETWTPEDLARRRELAQELAERLSAIGPPAQHPWLGVRRDTLDPVELPALLGVLARLAADLPALTEIASEAGRALGCEAPERLADIERLRPMLRAAATLPDCDRAALADPLWQHGPERLAALVRAGRAYAERRQAVEGVFAEAAWDVDLAACRAAIAERGASPFRLFSGHYRAAMTLLRAQLSGPPPKGRAACLALLDAMMAAQAARAAFEREAAAGPGAFGTMWRGAASDWPRLEALIRWHGAHVAQVPRDFPARLAAVGDLPELTRLGAALEERVPHFARDLEKLDRFLALDLKRAFGAASASETGLAALARRLDLWRGQPAALGPWIAFYRRCRAAAELGLGAVIDGLLDGALDAATLLPTVERAYYEALRAQIFARNPAWRRFDGEVHDRLVQSFRALDRERIALARQAIAARHAGELPRGNGGIGPLGVLNGELAKKRNHLAIRQLLDKAGPAIQQIKPIFMMSPLSVAQFLKPGALEFDLLVMDEASQIEPVDALGAIARCHQVVVVGDERQLPPTRFFAKLTADLDERDREEDGDEAEEVTFEARDAESILDLCLAKGMPHRLLNWHYRSRHQSLIAVSNREFYDNRLFIVPSPYDAVAGLGLKFHFLPQATYDRGNTRTNPVEARAVAEAVMRHAREHPDQSLGVATFSVAQRQAVLKELELLRRAAPESEEFFGRGSTEPFFVKNLENIQGDERDVIIISVGYGKTASGYLAMSFGPLNAEGGERRLNVLISRAKLRCEVFSSITGDDIDPERVRSRGVAALKLFLAFAQNGKLGQAAPTGRDPDSVFEEEVAARLRARGHDVRTQIGAAGFFVDLAIADRERPGRFRLGIECDGAPYHASRSARDRDRLRQHVLEEHGWIIHRIWSTDWYLRPAAELARVEAAIAAAAEIWRQRDEELAAPPPAVPLHFTPEGEAYVDAVGVADQAPDAPLATPYVEARLSVRSEIEPHEAPLAEMAGYVAAVVAAEGPVHEAVIVTRIRAAWGRTRTTPRLRTRVKAGIAAALKAGAIEGGPFYAAAGQPVRIRDRSGLDSALLRKAEHLPPAEIEAAILALVEANFGAARDELVQSTARLLGIAATSAPLREIIDAGLGAAIARGALREDGERLVGARPR